MVGRTAPFQRLGIAEKLLPPVTSLHIAPDELGRKAAKLLIEHLDKGARYHKKWTQLSNPASSSEPHRDEPRCEAPRGKLTWAGLLG